MVPKNRRIKVLFKKCMHDGENGPRELSVVLALIVIRILEKKLKEDIKNKQTKSSGGWLKMG